MKIQIQPFLLVLGVALTLNVYRPSIRAQSTTSDHQAKVKDDGGNSTTNAGSTVTDTNTTTTYIVTLRREADQDGCANDHQLKRKIQWHHALNGFVADLDGAGVQRLKKDKRVQAVEPDGRIAPSLITVPQVVPYGVARMGITNFPETSFNRPGEVINVDVAVVDTGIDTNHPELNVVNSVGFDASGGGLNGQDWSGHGTHVAGIIGALNNNFGVVGVASGVRLWSVQVFNQNDASWANALNAFDFIAQHADQISVANCSFGPPSTSATNPIVAVEQAVHNLVSVGVVVIAAAGNFAYDIAGQDGVMSTFDTNGNSLTVSGDDHIPASLPEVMAVSAMDPTTDTLANFSNFSKVPKVPGYVHSPGVGIDVAAPGVNILSTYLAGGSGYGNLSGTSMAAPHVTGLVALYIAANGRATNAAGVYKIRQAIIDSALPQSQWHPNGQPFDATNNPTGDPDGNPEPLAIASTNWIPAPNLVSQSQTDGKVQLNFAALPGYSYIAQYKDSLTNAQWANLSDSVVGIGGIAPVSLPDRNSNPSSRFYRLAMSPTPSAFLTTNASPNIFTIVSGGHYTNVYPDSYALNAYAAGVLTNQPGAAGNSFRFLNTNLFTGAIGRFVTVPISPDPSGFYPKLNPNGAFTVEFWARPAQLVTDLFCPASSLDASQNSGNSRCGWIFYLTPSNQWQFNLGGTNGFLATVSGGAAQANAWQYVCGVYDGTKVSLYVNGVLAAGPAAATGFMPNLSQPLRFGAASDGTRTFDGWLDESAIYTNALSAAQISAHYNAATTNNSGYAAQILADGPVGYWHFDN